MTRTTSLKSGRLGRPAPLPSDSLAFTGAPVALDPDQRRVTYLMLFRLALISTVLGSTLMLSWAGDVDLSAPASLMLFGIIGATYLLTIVYAIALRQTSNPLRLADLQVFADLITTVVLIHVTGGAQSAYSFFFPFAIIGAATIRFRRGAVFVALASAVLFVAISLLGWLNYLPVPAGQRLIPSDMSRIEFGRAVALNLAAIAGVGVLALNLGGQLQRTNASLQTQQKVAADLFTLHADIVRSLASGLVTIDTADRVVSANEAACEILGITAHRATGLSIEELLPGFLSLPADEGTPLSVRRANLELPRAGENPIYLGISVSPLRNNRDDLIGRVINFQDLTGLRAMEQQIKRSERMAAIGGLAAGVAHEIRNPLASISGSVELLSDSPQAGEDDRALMGIVTREVGRLNALLTDLLDYANPGRREVVSLDIAELCKETIRVFEQDRSYDGITIKANFNDAPIKVMADPNKLRQVLWNLLRNAADAITTASTRPGEITVELSGDAHHARFSVADNGPGIPQENLDRVFDPFFTTKVKGTGFGLATCHSIIDDHGGTITVANAPEGGAIFSIELPLAAGSRAESEPSYNSPS